MGSIKLWARLVWEMFAKKACAGLDPGMKERVADPQLREQSSNLLRTLVNLNLSLTKYLYQLHVL